MPTHKSGFNLIHSKSLKKNKNKIINNNKSKCIFVVFLFVFFLRRARICIFVKKRYLQNRCDLCVKIKSKEYFNYLSVYVSYLSGSPALSPVSSCSCPVLFFEVSLGYVSLLFGMFMTLGKGRAVLYFALCSMQPKGDGLN